MLFDQGDLFSRKRCGNIFHNSSFFLMQVRLVGDNIDYEIHARVQSQNHKNRSIHWTHQFAVLDRVQDPKLDTEKSQKQVEDIQLEEILPDRNVQSHLVTNWSVIVSRIITKYLIPFKCFQDVVVRHIPHKYSKEMSQKSTSVSIPISFPKQYILCVYEPSGL